MSFIINMVAKLGGITKLWGFLDGYKTKIGGTATFLAGLAGLLAQIVALIESKDASAVLHFVQGLPSDQSVLAMTAGLGIMGLAHKAEKSEAPKNGPEASQPK